MQLYVSSSLLFPSSELLAPKIPFWNILLVSCNLLVNFIQVA